VAKKHFRAFKTKKNKKHGKQVAKVLEA